MAGNNMLALAEKRAKREAAKKAAADAEAAIGTVVGTSTPQSPHPDATKTSTGVPTSPRISWATADPEEGCGYETAGPTRAACIQRFLGCRDEELPGPSGDLIKKDFEAVSKKLKEDEVKMQDALKKVKGLSGDNIKLTDKNKELEEEVEKLKIRPGGQKPITLEADAVRDEMKGPTESEMVDVKILGLDDSKPSGGETGMPSGNAAKE
ncbi:putative LIM and calponin-like proteiny domain-containing protein [Sesbania bispinosa]|nr:putative LIM and calponin-like proteiny domain-containing protein [Sesbania bispinosa]